MGKELKEQRKEIDRIDRQILRLLNRRARIVLEVGKQKAREGKEIYDPKREEETLKSLSEENKGPFPQEALNTVFREIISASRSLEGLLRVCFFGPEGSFTHLATLRHFGSSVKLVSKISIDEVFKEVEQNRVEFGVVPVENSLEGSVGRTLDLFIDSELMVFAEVLLPVSHDLLSVSRNLSDIEKIYSHPQAFAQCRKWLKENLSDRKLCEVESTALAAQKATSDPKGAAIASGFAGRKYGLYPLREGIEDSTFNATRFLVISKKKAKKSRRDKTSLLLSLKDEAGSLFRALEPVAREGINLTKIESRPLKRKAWEYIFFIDLDGHVNERKIQKALREVEKHCLFLKVLGSYPKARSEGVE
ncbi:MAG: prephenate dehydratase [Deltaproteobacteria bacterium]|nr:MAG: prephenate dehydratase [Deltaproteobacteria bacterium]